MQNNIADLSEGRELPEPRTPLSDSEEQPRHRGLLPIKKSESIYAKQLFLDDLTPEDIIWLDKGLQEDYHEVSVEEVLDGLVTGQYQLWRLGQRGIAVTAIYTFKKGKDLCIAWLAGEDWIAHLEEFTRDMEAFGKVHGCRWIPCLANRKGTHKLYKKLGKEVGTLFVREIKYV